MEEGKLTQHYRHGPGIEVHRLQIYGGPNMVVRFIQMAMTLILFSIGESIRSLNQSNANGDPDEILSTAEIHGLVQPEKSSSWKTCLRNKSMKDALALLDQQQVPDGEEFKMASRLWRHSDTSGFKRICDSICKYIKDKDGSGTYTRCVYAAYSADRPDDVFFVVIGENKMDLDIPYEVVDRCGNEYSSEGAEISDYEKNKFFTDGERFKLKGWLNKHSENFIKKHSNLTIISASSIKSNHFGKKTESRDETNCIVVYVHVKGLIPIDEERFPKELDGFHIDVREGAFKLCGGPKESHEQLKMGCQIRGDKTGTLGAFVEFQNSTFCITSAHVILNDNEMQDLVKNGTNMWEFQKGPKVYQPCDENGYFGNSIRAEYRPGDQSTSGVEVALIAIYTRHPGCGSFPEVNSSGFTFTSGQMYYPFQVSSGTEVIMFGAETGISKGRFYHEDAYVQDDLYGGSYKFHLKNQIVIKPDNPEGRPFAQSGDSGALVFVVINQDHVLDLRAFGIFEGTSSDGSRYVITPIWDVLRALGLAELKVFQSLARLAFDRICSLEKELRPVVEYVGYLKSMAEQNNG